MAGLVRPELMPAVKPDPFGNRISLLPFLGVTDVYQTLKGNLQNVRNPDTYNPVKDFLWPETTSGLREDPRAVYDRWVSKIATHPHVDICRAFGFKVDVGMCLNRGIGRVWNPHYLRANDIAQSMKTNWFNDAGSIVCGPSGMNLAIRYKVLKDWYQWGPAHLADSLAGFYYPPDSCPGPKVDIDEGRLVFKYAWDSWFLAKGGMSSSNYATYDNPPDISSLVENKGMYAWYPSAVAPTDASLEMLMGLRPGPDGTTKVSVQTLALLILTGSLCWESENGLSYRDAHPNDPLYYKYQLGKIYDSKIFSDASVQKWNEIYSQSANAWGKAYAQILPDISGFTTAFRAYLKDFQRTEMLFALGVTVACRMTCLIGSLGATLIAPQIGIPAVVAIVGSLKVLTAAALGEHIDWVGTAITVGAAAGAGSLLTDLAGNAGISKETLDTVTEAPKNLPKTIADAGLGPDGLGDLEDDMGIDIFGINVGIDTQGALDGIGDAVSSILPQDSIDSIIPDPLQDIFTSIGHSVVVKPSPPAPQKAVVQPGAKTGVVNPVAKVGGPSIAVIGLGLIALFFLVR